MHPEITPEPQTLYPTLGSLAEARQTALSQLPITDANQLNSILMTYHNTLLWVLASIH